MSDDWPPRFTITDDGIVNLFLQRFPVEREEEAREILSGVIASIRSADPLASIPDEAREPLAAWLEACSSFASSFDEMWKALTGMSDADAWQHLPALARMLRASQHHPIVALDDTGRPLRPSAAEVEEHRAIMREREGHRYVNPDAGEGPMHQRIGAPCAVCGFPPTDTGHRMREEGENG